MKKKSLVSAALILSMYFISIPISINYSMTVHAAELSQSVRWTGSGDRWQISDNKGGFIKNCWFQDDVTGHWYLLGAEDGSVMYAGLVTDKSTNKTYLLNPNHDGTFGRMLTVDGTYNLNGKNVHLSFNQSHDGTFGAITSGLSEARSSGLSESKRDNIPTDSAGQKEESKLSQEDYTFVDVNGVTRDIRIELGYKGILESIQRSGGIYKVAENFDRDYMSSSWRHFFIFASDEEINKLVTIIYDGTSEEKAALEAEINHVLQEG